MAFGKRILHVRLPCWKIFPAGAVYLADHLKREGFRDQLILDLALAPNGQTVKELERTIAAFSPQVIAFSWRNIQTFGPHDNSPALDAVLKFDYSNRLWDKAKSVYSASTMIIDHIQQIHRNFRLIQSATRVAPKAQVVVGGAAFSEFAEALIKRLPEGVIGVIGEGENALSQIVAEGDLDNENVVYMQDGKVFRGHDDNYYDLASAGPVDFKYIAEIFPEFDQYVNGFIGIQTKRGCPYSCIFCIYNVLEGKCLRFKRPEVVADEVEQLNREYGVNKIWFCDSQFCSSNKTVNHAEELLDNLIGRKLNIGWTGYIRLDNLTRSFAKKALSSGILSFELSFTGSQRIIDELCLGYQLSRQLEKFQMIKDLGYRGQQIKLYLPLNSPGESAETMLETINACKILYGLFGEENVVPWIFFLAIQPGTELERRLIVSGYLKEDYNPLSYNPFAIKKLLYNPPPYGSIVARAHLKATREAQTQNIGIQTLRELEKSLISV